MSTIESTSVAKVSFGFLLFKKHHDIAIRNKGDIAGLLSNSPKNEPGKYWHHFSTRGLKSNRTASKNAGTSVTMHLIRLIQNNSLVLSQFCGSIHIVLHLRQAYCQIRFFPLSANGGTKTFFFSYKLHLEHTFDPACSTGYPAASVSDTKVRHPEIFINC